MQTKLYFFSSGILRTKKHLLTMNRGINQDIDIPVPFFLIVHKGRKILFDTGISEKVIGDARKHWGSAVEAYSPVINERDTAVWQLNNLGILPEEIDIVILSHLHLDHAGAVGKFPNADYFVQRRELEWAYVPDFYQKAAYIKEDFDKNVRWNFLYGEKDDGYDLFGDGAIQVIFTPGHSPGHQSLKVNLAESGRSFVLAADSCYLDEILDNDIIPGLVWSPADCVKSINKLRYERAVNKAEVVSGHDPVTWEKYLKAPEFYT